MHPTPPHHLAIIMDGNRRWASPRGLTASAGHMQGASIVEAITEHAHGLGVKWLTLFAFSTENWNRSDEEINGLMGVLQYFVDKKMQKLIDNNVRLRIIGGLDKFAPGLQQQLVGLVAQSAKNTGINVTVALNYGGMADIATATRRLAKAARDGKLAPDAIDEAVIKSHLDTADLPAVDLLIRTGLEQRISNFILWDLAYAEMCFVPVMWPDFTIADLETALAEYASRDRRFGSDSHSIALTRSLRGGRAG